MKRDRHEFYSGISDQDFREFQTMLECLNKRSRSDVFTRLAALFERDFAAFLLVFEGKTISVPSRMYVERIAFYCKVWVYVQDQGGTPEAYQAASEVFRLPVARVTSICEKIMNLLERKIPDGNREQQSESGE